MRLSPMNITSSRQAMWPYCGRGIRRIGDASRVWIWTESLTAWQAAERTLGRGVASSARLESPSAETAVLLWQGVLDGPDDVARVLIPVPRSWLQSASRPALRVIGAWESPANQAVEDLWAARRVNVTLRPAAAAPALRSRGRRGHTTYPLLERVYSLDREGLAEKGLWPPSRDEWVLEISYEQIAEYPPSIDFSPHQRVGFALELVDETASPTTPQPAIQALPAAHTMVRLSVPANRLANPVVIRLRT